MGKYIDILHDMIVLEIWENYAAFCLLCVQTHLIPWLSWLEALKIYVPWFWTVTLWMEILGSVQCLLFKWLTKEWLWHNYSIDALMLLTVKWYFIDNFWMEKNFNRPSLTKSAGFSRPSLTQSEGFSRPSPTKKLYIKKNVILPTQTQESQPSVKYIPLFSLRSVENFHTFPFNRDRYETE